MKKCSVVIAAYNEAENLKNCLRSLSSSHYPREYLEIIVVDNGSTDDTAETVHRFKDVIYIKELTRGVASARNAGIKRASNDIIVFLDADAVVAENWLPEITAPFSDPGIGAVGGATKPLKQNNIISQYFSVSLFLKYPCFGKTRYAKALPGCNLAIRKELLVNGFNDFSRYGGEDKDLCYNILKTGKKVLFRPSAVIYHRHPDTFAGFIGILVKNAAGRVLYSAKHPSDPDIILFNMHVPLIFPVLFLFAVLRRSYLPAAVILAPVVLFYIYGGARAFRESGRFFLSFIVKPFLDIISTFLIYVLFHYYRISKTPIAPV